jgi:hypothetical protein
MTQIKILDKEKDYLLSVNAQQFVDSLDSASIFYELLEHDQLILTDSSNHKILSPKVRFSYEFNNISLIGIYNCLLNLICHNLYEGLVLRHYLLYKKQEKQFSLKNFCLKVVCIDYKDKNLFQKFEYQLGYTISFVTRIQDEIIMSNLIMFEHKIYIFPEYMTKDFLPKMLILYQDFADNIPI